MALRPLTQDDSTSRFRNGAGEHFRGAAGVMVRQHDDAASIGVGGRLRLAPVLPSTRHMLASRFASAPADPEAARRFLFVLIQSGSEPVNILCVIRTIGFASYQMGVRGPAGSPSSMPEAGVCGRIIDGRSRAAFLYPTDAARLAPFYLPGLSGVSMRNFC